MSKARDLANLISTGGDLADGLVNGGELEFTAAEAITAGQAVALDSSAQLVSIKAPITQDTDYADGNASVETTINQGTDTHSSQCYIKEHNIMVIASGEYGSNYAYIGTYSLDPTSGATLLDSDTISSVSGTWSAYTAYNEHTSTLYVACWQYDTGNPERCKLYAYSVASDGTLTRKFNFGTNGLFAPTVAQANGAQSVAFAIVPDSKYFMVATGKELPDDIVYAIYRDDTNEATPQLTYIDDVKGSNYSGVGGDTLGANGLSAVWHPDTSSFIVARRANLDDLLLEKITVNSSFNVTNKIHIAKTDYGMHNSLLLVKGFANKHWVLWTGIYDPDTKPYYNILDIQSNSIDWYNSAPSLLWDDTFDTDSTYTPSDTVVSTIIYNDDTDIVTITGGQTNNYIGDVIFAMPSSTDNQVTYKRFRFIDFTSSASLFSQDGGTTSWITPTGVSVNLTDYDSTNGIFWSEQDYTHYYVFGRGSAKRIAALDTYKPTEVFSNVDDFIGFAQNDIASGSTGKVISSGGILSTTGLTTGATYYIDSESGELTTATQNRKKAGLAKSTTELIVDDSPDKLSNLDNIRFDTNSNISFFADKTMLALTDQGRYGAGGSAYHNISMGMYALRDVRNTSYNIGLGYGSGQYLTTGGQNTFLGYLAGERMDVGSYNTAIGAMAMRNADTGSYNVAAGQYSLYANEADENVGIGIRATMRNTTGDGNTSVGTRSNENNTTGNYNTAVGKEAAQGVQGTTVVEYTTAMGYHALNGVTTGNRNTAIGGEALTDNTTGQYNTAVGSHSQWRNVSGDYNVSLGNTALLGNTSGDRNIGIGYTTLYTAASSSDNTAVGNAAGYFTSGSTNTFIGNDAGRNMTSGSGNTILGTFNGNELGLDIRTTDNNIVLSDGAGNPRVHVDTNGITKAQSYAEEYEAVTSTSNATTVNCRNGNSFSHTLTENTTFTFSNPPASGTSYSFSLEIIQDASASGFTVTWPASVDWPSATAPTLTATASAKDVFIFTTRDGGTTWYGFTAGQALG